LPFENQKRPLVQSKYAYLEAEWIQPFAQESVPKAALRLRQALGPLNRSEQHRGAMQNLDRRLDTAKYGKRLIKAVRKGLSVTEAPLPEILEEIKEFLNK
ncbi:helicase C-terminal domain-containing protein, partial [Enterococcus faecalis]|uniref:helicase C-terminal domain-containing protein n=1 Tax=Enterococcus faecalis TaxID=1351 RepID=UPI0031CD24A0